uniref:Arsenite methyltransferase n=1 Tax=Candidatus Kentrum sp. LPFa TaxID=2126335 RepID=A0A450WEV2_9GAMM|nr:MAG: Methyltransferase domain-containing protein [Candidatus Kentron sp. LPFa]
MHEKVKDYYGQILTGSADLKTSACCDSGAMPGAIKKIIGDLDDEIIRKFYGCGSPIPPVLEGCAVLDLGCGTGRDVYIVSKLVGEQGNSIGIDMTDGQLHVAKRHIDSQMKRFGYKRTNVDFKQGYIEDLHSAGIEDNSIDVVISNCVLNLSPDKSSVFKEIFRVLKPGGELYFSDVFADRRIPERLKDDSVLLGECLAGALYMEDFRRLLAEQGCLDYRVVQSQKIEIKNADIEKKIGMVSFDSRTIRAFKLDDLEDICEDYGEVATYKGTIPEHPHSFELDEHHEFITGKPVLVCGNTASMLQNTRYAKHWTVMGNKTVHYGPFDCTSNCTSNSVTVSSAQDINSCCQ